MCVCLCRGAFRRGVWKQRFFTLDSEARVLREYPTCEAWEGKVAASEDIPLQGSEVVSYTREMYVADAVCDTMFSSPA